MAVSAQFIVNELIRVLGGDTFHGYVVLWKGLCSITSTIGMGERVDALCGEVRTTLLVLLDGMMSTIMNGEGWRRGYLGLANETFRVYVLDEEG